MRRMLRNAVDLPVIVFLVFADRVLCMVARFAEYETDS